MICLSFGSLAITCATEYQRIVQALVLARRSSCQSTRENQSYQMEFLGKSSETYAVVNMSVSEKLPTVINEALNVLVMMHMIWIEFLTNAV